MIESVLSSSPAAARPEPVWLVRQPAPPQAVYQLSRELGVPPLLAAVLWSRGLSRNAYENLNPPLEPTAIPDLRPAASRLARALADKERILIHGDYDADGISGTAVLLLGLRALGANADAFIPDRLTDGYGICLERVAEHCERADLLVTVDCGISNLREIEALQRAGVEVIVSDHHQPGPEAPDCLVVHPALAPTGGQGLPELTGAGVAYHLLWALHEQLGLDAPLEYSDLATIGTIADVAPLMGENRALIRHGLERLADSRWPGLRAMVRHARLGSEVRARDVAFVIAPRLNAAGRLGEAELGLELLTTSSERRARELATYLDARNVERRKIQDRMLAEAMEMADPEAPALVLHRPGWHPGVMGIVAGKLLEHFYKPVFIIAEGKGSARSMAGLSAVDGLRYASGHLLRFGGHTQAAGFALEEDAIPGFRESIFEFVRSRPCPPPVVEADALLAAADIDRDLFEATLALEPCGKGNPAPLFALVDTLDAARAVGADGRHLQLRVGGVKGVSWRKGPEAARLIPGSMLDVAVSLQENEWRGKRSIEFVAEHLRGSRPLTIDSLESGEPCERIRKHAPPEGADARQIQGILPESLSAGETYWLTALPLNVDSPLGLFAPLETLVRLGAVVHFDLGASELARLQGLAETYPSVSDLRQAFSRLRRGSPLPWGGVKAELCLVVLRELELLDARGFALRAQKRDPYQSHTLVAGLVERYRLRSVVKAYRHLDAASFALTVRTLFGHPSA